MLKHFESFLKTFLTLLFNSESKAEALNLLSPPFFIPLTAKLPEPTTPPMKPATRKPDIYDPPTPTPAPVLHPEQAEIQARQPEPVEYSPTERPPTASTDYVDYNDQGFDKVKSVPLSRDIVKPDQHEVTDASAYTTASVTPTPILADVESVPIRVNMVPMDLAPLPTTQSKAPYLDISHGGTEEGGQVGPGQVERSGSGEGGSSDDSASGAVLEAEVTPTQVPTLRSSWLLETTTGLKAEVETTSRLSQLLQVIPDNVMPEILTTEPGVPAGVEQVGRDPAVVFKEDVTTGATPTLDLDQSLAIPVDKNSTALPPIHVIFVNVSSQNQSSE